MPDQNQKDRTAFVTRALRLAGVFFMLVGAAVFFDAGGLVSGYFGTEPYIGDTIHFHHILGGLFAFVGVMDVVVAEVLFRGKDEAAT